MHYSNQPADRAWSDAGRATALIAAGGIAAAWFVALRPTRLPLSTLVTVTAIAIGGVVVIARCRMPLVAKGGLTVAACASLLVLAATQDGLGLRAVNGRAGRALAAANVTAAEAARIHPAVPSRIVATDARMTAAARAAGRAADAGVGTGDIAVMGGLSADHTGGWRLNWSITRGDAREWCGLFSEAARAGHPDFAAFRERVVQAARGSRGKPLACA